MAKIELVIIEDEFFAANHLSELLDTLGYRVKGIFYSGEDFLHKTDWRFDAAIVDIFLADKLSGLDLAEELHGRQKPFIFLTANQDAQTLKAAARLAPRAYITKPFRQSDVQAALEIIALGLVPKLQVKVLRGFEDLHPADILFIRSDGVYIEIVTLRETLVQRKLLKDIAHELPDSFIRVHRSYIVNSDYIAQRSSAALIVHGHEIPVSRSFRNNLR
ncbi:MAG: response regulator transcription factor [Bacteroidetes bacterium]|nr:response regulator transcription factor [Bacteroidota bacterium]